MRPTRILFMLVAALALVTACSAPAGPSPSAGGQDGLAFASRTLAGAEFTGQSLAGKPTVLWFWSPWCSICRSEAPAIAKAAQQHPDVTFVGVAAMDQLPAMQKFVADNELGGDRKSVV